MYNVHYTLYNIKFMNVNELFTKIVNKLGCIQKLKERAFSF